VFDEVFLREGLGVNTRGLTYHGLEDFGDGFDVKTSEKANPKLVLMIQSLTESLHQPLAVFASKESVKGKFRIKYNCL